MNARFSFKDFGRKIPLSSAIEWLKQHGWSVQGDNRGGLTCQGPLDDNGDPITRTLPEDESYADFLLRLEDLIVTLSVIEERPAYDIALEIKETQSTADVALDYGSSTINDLMSILEKWIVVPLSPSQQSKIVGALQPILVEGEISSDVALPQGVLPTTTTARVAARLAMLLPINRGTKRAILECCSRLLGIKLPVTKSGIDELYNIASSEAKKNDPENTCEWLIDQTLRVKKDADQSRNATEH